MTTTSGWAVTVPLPTSHAVPDVLVVLMQEPPLIDALASSPGGRLIVRLWGESVPVSVNFRSIPRFACAPAALPALWLRLSDGVIAAPAAGARDRTPAITAAAVTRRTTMYRMRWLLSLARARGG